MIQTDKLIICVAPCRSFLTKEANPNMPVTGENIFLMGSGMVAWHQLNLAKADRP